MTRRESRAVRAYRHLLRALPGEFRRRFGDEMVVSFADEWARVRATKGGAGRAAFLVRSALHVVGLGFEEHWDSRTGGWAMDGRAVARDLRIAGRTLGREPGFTATAVVALGLGIGLTTSAFSIVHGTVLRGLPFDAPHELVHFERGDEERSSLPVVPHDLVDWREANRTFVDLAAYTEAVVTVTDASGAAERVYGTSIEPRAFALLGVEATRGRLLTEADDTPGGPPVVLLGDGLWKRRFDGDPGAVGRTLRINDVPHTIVGVMPEGFGFPLSEEFWLPLRLDLSTVPRGEGRLDVFGRLRPGVELDQARADFARISAALADAHPGTNGGVRAVLRPYTDEYVDEDFGQLVVALLVAAAFVLLLAALNVASLMLARGTRRAREVAVRVSLGAGRGRVVQHLLAEAAVLGAGAASGGVGLAWFGVGWFAGRGTRPGTFQLAHGDAVPFWWDVGLDPTSLAFVLVVTVGTVVATGLLPALRALDGEPEG
ncbi:MAG: ABC transporter permease, partial [Longimicrobiales bacterium]